MHAASTFKPVNTLIRMPDILHVHFRSETSPSCPSHSCLTHALHGQCTVLWSVPHIHHNRNPQSISVPGFALEFIFSSPLLPRSTRLTRCETHPAVAPMQMCETLVCGKPNSQSFDEIHTRKCCNTRHRHDNDTNFLIPPRTHTLLAKYFPVLRFHPPDLNH